MSNEDYRSCIMTAVNEIQDNKALEFLLFSGTPGRR